MTQNLSDTREGATSLSSSADQTPPTPLSTGERGPEPGNERGVSELAAGLRQIAHHFESRGYAHGQHLGDARTAKLAARRLEQLEDELEDRRSAPPAGWQGIETAPRDGTWFLALMPGYVPMVVRWNGDGWDEPNEGELKHYAPTLWTPLPPGPSTPDDRRLGDGPQEPLPTPLIPQDRELIEALRKIAEGPRNADASYLELFMEDCEIARKALLASRVEAGELGSGSSERASSLRCASPGGDAKLEGE